MRTRVAQKDLIKLPGIPEDSGSTGEISHRGSDSAFEASSKPGRMDIFLSSGLKEREGGAISEYKVGL